MALTHWKKLRNNDYLGSWVLEPNQEMILTIDHVTRGIVASADGKKEEQEVMFFKEDGIKPMVVNTTNAKTISKIYNTPYVENWAGKKIQIYATSVRAFGGVTEALRIRDFEPCKCGECGKQIEPYQKMTASEMSLYTYSKYKKPLCADCATKHGTKQND